MSAFNFTVRAIDSLGRSALSEQSIEVLDAISFDPSNTHSSIGLSNGNQTATGLAGHSTGLARLLRPKSSGRWYVEMTMDHYANGGLNGYGMLGLSTPAQALSQYIGQASGCCALWWVGGSSNQRHKFYANATTGILPGGLPSNVGMAWDADAGKVWWRADGAWLEGDPAEGTGASHHAGDLSGEHYAAVTPRNVDNAMTVRVTPLYTIPSGFSYW